MPRPCTCDNLPSPGEPWAKGYCRLCWLYHNDERYRRKWDELGLGDLLRCRHLGEATGQTVVCGTCSGHVELKLFACAIHSTCTTAKQATGHACCAVCLDRDVPPAVQLEVSADGIGDHILGLSVAAAYKQAHPDTRLVFVARPHVLEWCRLFGGYDDLRTSVLPSIPKIHDVSNRGGLHYVEACRRAPSIPPPVRELPSDAVEWAKQFAGHVVLAPWCGYKRPDSPDWAPSNRVWLRSHWLTLELLLMDAGYRTVVIDTDAERNDYFIGDKAIGESPARVAALMRAAACVVGNESGMAHLAGALGTPCVVLSALLDGRRIHGLWPRSRVLQGPLGCTGCHWSGPHYRSHCETLCASLQSIQPEDVAKAVGEIAPRWEDWLGRLVIDLPPGHLAPRADRRPTMGRFLEHMIDRPHPLVVETGCVRQLEDVGAGMSTVLFGQFLREHNGRLVSVDNDPDHVAFARKHTQGLPVDVVLADGRIYLWSHEGPAIDGLYLDSADLWTEDYDLICLAEAKAALPHLAPDAVILIDDTIPTKTGEWEGKGRQAVPWLIEQGWEVRCAGYQALLQRKLGQRIAVVSAFTPDYAPWAERFAESKADYCRRHGYTFKLHRDGFDASRPAAWSKLLFVDWVLHDHDWVVWMDADVEIKNPAIMLEHYLDTDKNLVITSDVAGPNSGVFALRACQWSLDFLDELWNFNDNVTHRWWENRGFHALVPKYPNHCLVLPQKGLNSYPDCYSEGDFLLHYAGDHKSAIRD